MKILVLNSGSSSQKACLYEIADTLPGRPPTPFWEGNIQRTGDNAALSVKNAKGAVQKESLKLSSREDCARHLLHTLHVGPVCAVSALSDIDAVGHRVAHGARTSKGRFSSPGRSARELQRCPTWLRYTFARSWKAWGC